MREIRLQVDGRLNEKSYIRYSFRESEPIEATRYLSTKICTYMYVHMYLPRIVGSTYIMLDC